MKYRTRRDFLVQATYHAGKLSNAIEAAHKPRTNAEADLDRGRRHPTVNAFQIS
jgi:hypothetical protein